MTSYDEGLEFKLVLLFKQRLTVCKLYTPQFAFC